MSTDNNDAALSISLVTAELLAVIAAAAAVFLKKRVAIRSVELAKGKSSKWIRQGRAVHLASHNMQSGRPGTR